MKKIYVDAYINSNLGDDLFLKILFQRYPNAAFYFKGNKKYRKIFKDYQNVFIIINPIWKKAINTILFIFLNKLLKLKNARDFYLGKGIKIKEYDAFVKIGGSIFIDADGKHFEKNSKTISSFIQLDKPVFILGCNFEKNYERNFYLQYKEFFSGLKPDLFDLSFRDEFSYNLFATSESVRYSPDIIFGYNNSQLEAGNDYVGFSIIDLSERKALMKYKEIYEKKIHDIICECIKNNEKVALFSFCAPEGDESTINNIVEKIESKYKQNIRIFNYSNGIDDFLTAYSKSKVIIATRFHAMILGWLFQKKVIPIIYSEKMMNVIEDTKFKGKYFYVEDIGEMEYEDINSDYKFPDLYNNIKKSNQHFLKLDYFLRKE